MSTKTALVTGATGLLGRQIFKIFERDPEWSVKGTGFSRADGSSILKVDVTDEAAVAKVLDDVRPDAVIHCAANRRPDLCESDADGARAVNVRATQALARLCAARPALLVYISTDYVFSGRAGEAPYEGDAATAPPNTYGQTKLEGEAALAREFDDAAEGAGKTKDHQLGVVLRVPVLYGPAETPAESGINVLVELVEKAQAEGSAVVKMDHWSVRYPTNTEDVARVCRDVANLYLKAASSKDDSSSSLPLPRILQFTGEARYTKYEICDLFGQMLGLPVDRIKSAANGGDLNAATNRPYDCHLSTRALQEIGVDVSTQDFVGWWRRELRAYRK